jgi:uncharacterized Zn-finger protein
VGSRNSVGPDGEALGRNLLAERWREMQMESYPKFQNEIGVPIVRIGCHEFECIGDKPPQDHPHIYLNMGDASDIVCLIIAAGGDEAIRRCQPLFDAIGQKTFGVGDKPSAANLVKLSGNFLITSIIESLGEAFALVRKSGVDPHRYLEILTGTLFSAPVYKTYGGLIAEEKYEPGLAMTFTVIALLSGCAAAPVEHHALSEWCQTHSSLYSYDWHQHHCD